MSLLIQLPCNRLNCVYHVYHRHKQICPRQNQYPINGGTFLKFHLHNTNSYYCYYHTMNKRTMIYFVKVKWSNFPLGKKSNRACPWLCLAPCCSLLLNIEIENYWLFPTCHVISCQLLIDCSLPFKRWGAKVDFSENWSIQSPPVVDIVTEVPPGLARFLFSLDGRECWSELPAHPVEDPIVLHTANDLISPGLATTI